jgi:hypothetical protein
MDFLALVRRVHSESLRTTTVPTSVSGGSEQSTRLANAVADAWLELQSERDWKWMRGTTDAALTIGQQVYTGVQLGVATRFGRWREEDDAYWPIVYVDGTPNAQWPLHQWGLDDFKQNWIYRTQGSSTPIAFAVDESDRLMLGPAPSVAYKIRADYWKEPSKLTADADEPDMPERFHMVLVWRALQEIAKSDAAPEVLSRADVNYGLVHQKLMFDQARLPHL